MRELTNERYIEIGAQVSEADTLLGKGHIAYAASYPHAVAEALEEPDSEEYSAGYESAMRMPSLEGTFMGGWNACVRFYTARRRRLTAKPDPAVEAVEAIMLRMGQHAVTVSEEIVAAVDAARKGAK